MSSRIPDFSPPQYDEAIVHYRIDSNDVIQFVCPSWDHFAMKNNGGDILAPAVLGRNLWDFVANIETRHVYQTIVDRIRAGQARAIFPFRCDSPDRRRFMQMEMKLAADNGIEFVSEVLREEFRDPVLLLDQSSLRSEKYLSMCSWCKKIEIAGEWHEVENAVIALDLFKSTVMPQISHTICDTCSSKLDSETD